MEKEKVIELIKAINRRNPLFFKEQYSFNQLHIGKDWEKDYPLTEQEEYLKFILTAVGSENQNANDAVGLLRICGATIVTLPNGKRTITYYTPNSETAEERKEHRAELLDVLEATEEFWPELHDALNK